MGRLLWIGSYADVETEDFLKEHIQYKKPSTCLSQRNIVEGLEQIKKQKMECLGAVSLPGYPVDRKLWVASVSKERNGVPCKLVGFFNLRYINKLTTIISLTCAARKWVRKNRCDDGVEIFVYETRSACLRAASVIKKKMPNTNIHLIIPDLPAYMDLHMSPLKRVLKWLDEQLIRKNLANVDNFILYAEAMADELNIRHRPWIVMEGSVRVTEEAHSGHAPEKGTDAEQKCIVMYSGNLDSRFGLLNLVQAMDYLDDRYELWISGMGADAQAIETAAKDRSNVKYFGFLKDQTEVMRMQSQATALINMRDPKEKASKYCFPSKLFEYMLSGKPVLSCRLDGIPNEYFDYLIPMNSIQPEDIAAAIREIACKSPEEREQIGTEGKQFIRERKNNLAQAQRIIDFTLR